VCGLRACVCAGPLLTCGWLPAAAGPALDVSTAVAASEQSCIRLSLRLLLCGAPACGVESVVAQCCCCVAPHAAATRGLAEPNGRPCLCCCADSALVLAVCWALCSMSRRDLGITCVKVWCVGGYRCQAIKVMRALHYLPPHTGQLGPKLATSASVTGPNRRTFDRCICGED
jgi:hypothetical protein